MFLECSWSVKYLAHTPILFYLQFRGLAEGRYVLGIFICSLYTVERAHVPTFPQNTRGTNQIRRRPAKDEA